MGDLMKKQLLEYFKCIYKKINWIVFGRHHISCGLFAFSKSPYNTQRYQARKRFIRQRWEDQVG